MTDLYGIFLNYYYYNFFFTIIVGFILFVVTLACVNLNKSIKNVKKSEISDFLTFFDFFKDFITFSFIRKQNLNIQNFRTSSTQIFKKCTKK